MAGAFDAASSQYLLNSSPPFVTFPFTVALWFKPDTIAAGNANLFSMSDNAGTVNFFRMYRSTAALRIGAAAGAAESVSTIATNVIASVWHFVLFRCISATNRRVLMLGRDGQIGHVQGTTSRSPGGLDNWALGGCITSTPTEFYAGLIGEYWITDTDVQPDGLQTQDWLARQLAYGGPFSVPHIAKDVVEYRSLRVFTDSRGDRSGEVFHGKFGRRVWANTNGVTTGPHPPLPYWYMKPNQAKRQLVI